MILQIDIQQFTMKNRGKNPAVNDKRKAPIKDTKRKEMFNTLITNQEEKFEIASMSMPAQSQSKEPHLRNSELSDAEGEDDLTLAADGPATQTDLMTSKINQLLAKNKINSKNAFDVPMIRLNDVSDFKTTFNDNTWKNLSSTLEGGYKIYGYRVDATHDITFRMLESISRQQTNKSTTHQNTEHQIAENDESKTKSVFISNSYYDSDDQFNKTLETNMRNISIEHVDIYFNTDPIIEKTRRKFDQTGYKSCFLNTIHFNHNFQLQITLDTKKKLIQIEESPEDQNHLTQIAFELYPNQIQSIFNQITNLQRDNDFSEDQEEFEEIWEGFVKYKLSFTKKADPKDSKTEEPIKNPEGIEGIKEANPEVLPQAQSLISQDPPQIIQAPPQIIQAPIAQLSSIPQASKDVQKSEMDNERNGLIKKPESEIEHSINRNRAISEYIKLKNKDKPKKVRRTKRKGDESIQKSNDVRKEALDRNLNENDQEFIFSFNFQRKHSIFQMNFIGRKMKKQTMDQLIPIEKKTKAQIKLMKIKEKELRKASFWTLQSPMMNELQLTMKSVIQKQTFSQVETTELNEEQLQEIVHQNQAYSINLEGISTSNAAKNQKTSIKDVKHVISQYFGAMQQSLSFRQVYSKYLQVQGSISPALCFLAVLHLANEENLTLTQDEQMFDFIIHK